MMKKAQLLQRLWLQRATVWDSASESHSAGHMCSVAKALKCGMKTTEKEMLKSFLSGLRENGRNITFP